MTNIETEIISGNFSFVCYIRSSSGSIVQKIIPKTQTGYNLGVGASGQFSFEMAYSEYSSVTWQAGYSMEFRISIGGVVVETHIEEGVTQETKPVPIKIPEIPLPQDPFCYKDNVELHQTEQFKFSTVNSMAIRTGLKFKIFATMETLTITSAAGSYTEEDWSFEYGDSSKTWLYVTAKPTAPIGHYTFQIGSAEYNFYLLFNTLEMKLALKKEEIEYYTMDEGYIYLQNQEFQHWRFGQYDAGVLSTIFQLLAIDYNQERMHDPNWVAKRLSAVLNAKDENGLLKQKWHAKYDKKG